MGTLFNQRPRQETLMEGYLSTVRYALLEMGVQPEHATPDQWIAACEIVKAALAVQNADALDEQLAGFGELLRDLIEAIKRE
jgi:hypothetical protein